MTDAEKIAKFDKIEKLARSGFNPDMGDYCDDIAGESGMNIDDAYSIGQDYGENNTLSQILTIIDE